MNRLRFACAALSSSMLAFGTSAGASFAQPGIITSVGTEQGKAFFITNGPRNAMPACATAGNRWVFDASTSQGQAMMSTLLTAYAAGKQVIVQGTGACADWGDTESVEYIWTAAS